MSEVTPIASGQRPSNRWLHGAIAGFLAASVGVQVVRDRGWQPYQPSTPALWFQSGPMLKRVSLGFENLVADVYWMRAVIYYGGKRRATSPGQNFELLDPLLTFVTTLDPRFKVAYRFGAIFLTEAYPSGPGRPDRAIALLQRGFEADPTAWEYLHDIGFVYYWWLRDYRAAAEWFDRAGRLPGAPTWLSALAATTLAQGGDRQASRFLWRQLFDSSDVDWLRRNAQLRLTQLDAMDALEPLNAASSRFAARMGRPAKNWQELIAGERLRGVPLDPTGVPYELDPATGSIDVSRKSQLWPLPVDRPTPQSPSA